MSILLGRQHDTHPLQILVRFCALPGQLQGYQDEQETVLRDLNGKRQSLSMHFQNRPQQSLIWCKMYSGTAIPQAYLPKSSCFRRQHNNKRPTSSTGCSGGNVIGVVKWHCLQYLSIWHKKSYKNTQQPLFNFVFK